MTLCRGTLINRAASAGARLIDARLAVATAYRERDPNPERIARARIAMWAAQHVKLDTNAALDAVGRFGSTPRVTS